MYSRFKIVIALCFTIVTVLLSQVLIIPGLSAQGRLAFAIILSTVFAWAIDFVHAGYITLLMFAALGATSTAPPSVVFGLFVTPLAWMMIGSFLLAHAVVSSGLATRIAYLLLGRVARGYRSVVISIYVSGLFLSIVIPHPIPRTLMLWAAYRAMFERFTSDDGVLRRLCLAVFSSSVVTSMVFLTADSVLNLAATSLVGRAITWVEWLRLMAAPSLVMTALHCAAFLVVFGRGIRERLGDAIDARVIQDELERMGPVTEAEKKTIFWILLAVVLWATDSLHGINPAWVALACSTGLALPQVGGVLTTADLSKAVNWPTLIFVAGASAVGNVASSTGVTAWLSSLLAPLGFPSGGPQFALVASGIVMVVHLLVGGALTSLAVAGPVLVPVGTKLGFDPVVSSMIAYVVSNMQFVFPFQHVNILLGQNEPHGYRTAEVLRFAPIVTVLTLLGVAFIYVPWWAAIGVLRPR